MLKKVPRLSHVKTAAVKVPDPRLCVESLRKEYEATSPPQSDSKRSQKPVVQREQATVEIKRNTQWGSFLDVIP